MISRDRVETSLNHKEPDRLPVDLGGSLLTSMHVTTVYKLRQALGLDKPGTPVRVTDVYQMLGEIKPDLVEMFGLDVIELPGRKTMFGFGNTGWKEWELFDGTPLLVQGDFNTEPNETGDIFMYPEGDKSVPPSGRMPKDGFYFDAITRQGQIDDDNLNVEDNLEEFSPVSNEDLEYYKKTVADLYENTNKAILAGFGGTGFGDIALVPAPWMKHTKGIRDIEEWYVSTVIRKDYVYKVFERQCELAIENLEKIYKVVGDRITALMVTGTDFGMQTGTFIAPSSYRDLYQPFHKIVNNWVHKNTKWKTFIHSCGSVWDLMEDFIDSGFDILNPVQCSAAKMDAQNLKEKFGDRITFWGGGVDTQKTLAFGTPDDVKKEVRERIRIFGKNGGFVFAGIHNIQAKTPPENILAVFETIKEFGEYPLR